MREMSQYQDMSIGPYRLTKLIGVGPVSRVFLAEHQSCVGQKLALKLFEAVPLDLLEEKDQALEELRLLACLEHPTILPSLADGLHENMLYQVSPYIEAGSLRQRLISTAGELLPLKELFAILLTVGEALHYAHGQGIVHANLKPENILIQDDGKALLADFLLPSLVKSERAARILSTFAAFYMAPEQFQGAATPLSDQYALASLAYELLTGQPPFEGDDVMSLARKHSTREPRPPSLLQPKRAQHIDNVLLKALAKRPEERYADIRAFLAELSAPPPLVALASPLETLLGVAQPPVRAEESALQPFQKALPLSIAVLGQDAARQGHQNLWPVSIPVFEEEIVPQASTAAPAAVVPDLHNAATLAMPMAAPEPLVSASQLVYPEVVPLQQAILRARTRSLARLSPRQVWLTTGLIALTMLLTISGVLLFLGTSSHSAPPQNHVQRISAASSPTLSAGQPSPGVTATPTTAPAKPSPTPAAKPTTAPATGLSCQVNYDVASQWPGGFVVNLTIKNTSTGDIRGWTLVFTFPGGQRITNSWNGHFAQNGAQVSVTNADYNVTLAPGASTNPGFQATSSTGNIKPKTFSLNGVPCK